MTLSPLAILYFIAAVAVLLLSHIVRTVRWRLILVQTGIAVSNLQPLASLSLGYLVNTVLPFRLGEVVRGAYLAYAAKANPVSVLATIVFERTIDLLAVAALALVLLLSPINQCGAGAGRSRAAGAGRSLVAAAQSLGQAADLGGGVNLQCRPQDRAAAFRAEFCRPVCLARTAAQRQVLGADDFDVGWLHGVAGAVCRRHRRQFSQRVFERL
ncbi:lysylphosphatidylglycerol synthase domain-containing protein [Devosia sp.]|uniref:lysylphosphatidylglycerol synthase domain-containing protein n=1 Tax=Devosia sp. TaxID=1871048 RepID=UPI00326596A4